MIEFLLRHIYGLWQFKTGKLDAVLPQGNSRQEKHTQLRLPPGIRSRDARSCCREELNSNKTASAKSLTAQLPVKLPVTFIRLLFHPAISRSST
jgi:hypothetical protein